VGGLSQDELFGDYCALLQFWRYFEVRSTAFSFLSSYVFFFFCREPTGMLLKQ
jgi:hypothetical protein